MHHLVALFLGPSLGVLLAVLTSAPTPWVVISSAVLGQLSTLPVLWYIEQRRWARLQARLRSGWRPQVLLTGELSLREGVLQLGLRLAVAVLIALAYLATAST